MIEAEETKLQWDDRSLAGELRLESLSMPGVPEQIRS